MRHKILPMPIELERELEEWGVRSNCLRGFMHPPLYLTSSSSSSRRAVFDYLIPKNRTLVSPLAPGLKFSPVNNFESLIEFVILSAVLLKSVLILNFAVYGVTFACKRIVCITSLFLGTALATFSG